MNRPDPLAVLFDEVRRSNELTSALYRDRVLAGDRYADPLRLTQFGFKVYSQGDEDGILEEIFRRIDPGMRRFVEIGMHPLECNTLYLLARGWSGVWVDAADHDLRPVAHHLTAGRLRFVRTAVSRENANALVCEGSVGAELDLLSIDIDGNDYWVWEALEVVRPRVMVIEYNATFPPPVSVAVPYDPARAWDRTNRFGASLEALARLGAKKGYALVGCGFTGVNAYFVRTDISGDRFRGPFTAAEHYEPARYFVRLSGGHRSGHGPLTEIT